MMKYKNANEVINLVRFSYMAIPAIPKIDYTPDMFIKDVCKALNTSFCKIISRSNKSDVAEARHIIIGGLAYRFEMKPEDIAMKMKRHRTIYYSSLRTFNNLFETNKNFKQKIEIVKKATSWEI